jgi:hypothetical protein
MTLHDLADEAGQHLLLLLSIVVAALTVRRYLRDQASHRKDLLIAQHEQTLLLKRIDKELHPNGGASLADRVERIESSVDAHHADADKFFRDNEEAHGAIHRRIDGVYELLGGSTGPRIIAERHRSEREDKP